MKSKKFHIDPYMGVGLLAGALLAVGFLISCGGSNTPSAMTTGTVNVSMTDPATCNGPTGFDNIYVTVTKVTANINANAGPNDSGWQTLVDLTNSPMQIDLLSLANPSTTCLLKTLGASGPLPAGKYQQIRLYLLGNTPASGTQTPGTNLCQNNTGWNCVVSGPQNSLTYAEIQLPSEVQTGIKINSSQITSGGLTVTANQSVDFNIDFQSCESIVREGNQQYRLKPVLFGGEVTQNMNSISGQVVVGNSSGQPVLGNSGAGTPIPGATVLFEQPDSSGNEMVIDGTTTDPNGNFFVCPMPVGPTNSTNFDVVVAAQTSDLTGTTTYNPTVAFSVPVGTRLTNIPMVPETASGITASTGPATISGQVDTAGSGGAIGEDVTLTPTMSIAPTGGSAFNVIIPAFTANGLAPTGQPPAVPTSATPSPSTPACASGTDCNNFSLTVPASNPNVGTFSNSSIAYGVQTSSSVTYSLTGSADSCTSATDSSIAVTPGNTSSAPTLSLTGCM